MLRMSSKETDIYIYIYIYIYTHTHMYNVFVCVYVIMLPVIKYICVFANVTTVIKLAIRRPVQA